MSGPLELRFQWPVEPSPGPVALRFGAPDVTPESVEGDLLATLEALAPPVTFAVIGTPVLDLIDVDGVRAGIAHQQATPAGRGLSASQQHMLPGLTAAAARQQQAVLLSAGAALAHQQMQAARRSSRAAHQHGTLRAGSTRPRHAEAIRTRRSALEAHQHGLPVGQGAGIPAAETLKYRRAANARHQHAISARARVRAGHHAGLKVTRRLAVEHQQMIPLPVGWWQAVYPWPPDPTPDLPAHLRFCRINDGTHALIFGCRPAQPQPGVVVPIREVYIVINTFSLVRADNGLPVDVSAFRVGLDADSWGWSWSAQLHADLLPLVRGEPGDFVELIATINGTPIRILVESIRRDRRFANSTLAIGGRTRAAWLADPHSPTITRHNDASLTAQQLLDAALTLNGVPLGWSLDWQIDDWLVTPGAWSYVGNYIGAATRIAEAGGGYVQAHDTDQTLIILPRYPEPPWRWHLLTPDIVLPEDVVTVEGIEQVDRPRYNAVYVSGTRTDRYRRTGTAADHLAPTIIDPLATAVEMTRQRGRVAVSDTGRQEHIRLRLPVLPETGIIRPGALIDYTENGQTRRGITRGVDVDVAFPAVWQELRIETHVE